MKVTLKDIATEANVSITTVSYVINNVPNRVSAETRQKILDIAERLKYVPNITARQLVTRKYNAIGIIVPDFENHFFSGIVSRIQQEMRHLGYFVFVVTSNDAVEEDMSSIEMLVSRGIDLLIIAVSNQAGNHEDLYLSKLESLPVPVIMIDRVLNAFKGTTIAFDDVSGMEKLTTYVIENNHTNIAFVNGDQSMVRTKGRIEGFRNALASHHQTFDSRDVYQGNYTHQSGYDLFDEIFDSHRYTAIIAANDMMAYGLMKRLFERGLHVPNSISICGYDNIKFSEMLNPALTTVNQNIDNLAAEALRIIPILLQDPSYTETVILKTELIVRESVKAL